MGSFWNVAGVLLRRHDVKGNVEGGLLDPRQPPVRGAGLTLTAALGDDFVTNTLPAAVSLLLGYSMPLAPPGLCPPLCLGSDPPAGELPQGPKPEKRSQRDGVEPFVARERTPACSHASQHAL